MESHPAAWDLIDELFVKDREKQVNEKYFLRRGGRELLHQAEVLHPRRGVPGGGVKNLGPGVGENSLCEAW